MEEETAVSVGGKCHAAVGQQPTGEWPGGGVGEEKWEGERREIKRILLII